MSETKIALVSGGSRGLGKNMAKRLAERGFDVVITYQSQKVKALETVKEIEETGRKAHALQLDVSQPHSYDGFISDLKSVLEQEFRTQQLHALINNAGIGIYANYADTTEEQFDLLMNIHFKSVFFLTQKALPLIADGGSIVNITTGLVRFALPGYDAYASMKGAVETLTRYQAKTLGPRGIRVNALAPGAIETDFGGGAVRDNPELNSFVAAQTALGRAGVADDIGGVAAFLCSEEGRWVNGQRIEVSGGMFL